MQITKKGPMANWGGKKRVNLSKMGGVGGKSNRGGQRARRSNNLVTRTEGIN